MPAVHAGRWTGGGLNLQWSDPDNWAPIGVPGPNNVVFVDHEIILDISTSVGTLTLDPSATSPNAMGGITPFGGRNLTLNAGVLNNNGGLFRLNASGLILVPSGLGESFINGTGQIFMQDSAANFVRANGGVLFHGVGHTIIGSGNLLGNRCGLVNNGTILAEATVLTNGAGELVMSNALVIDPGGTNNTFVNHGILEARGTAGLVLQSGVFLMGTNYVDTYAGSTLSLGAGAVLRGGKWRTLTNLPAPSLAAVARGLAAVAQDPPEGVIKPGSGAVLEGVTLAGHVVQANGVWPVDLVNGLVNNGRWSLNGDSGLTWLRYAGSQTLSGAGRIVMSDSVNNRISPLNSGEVLTNGPNHTIQGAGKLLANNGGLVNQGAILADQPTNPLSIDPNNQTFVNQGTLRATGAAGLRFEAGRFINTGHTIDVQDGSKLALRDGSVIQGGVLSTTGSGAIMPGSGAIFDNATLAGHVVQANGVWPVDLVNGLVNNGLWSLNGNSGLTWLRYDGSQTVSGSGRIEMSDSANNRISPLTSGEVLTNGSGHTIQGAGNLLNNKGGLVNEGAILADQPANSLNIDPDDQGFVNQGTLRATGAAGLRFEAGRFVNTGHTIEVLEGSKLTLANNTVVQGGVLSTTGSGAIMPGSGAIFDDATLAGHVVQANGVWPVDLVNGLVNNGLWSLNGNSGLTWLRYNGSQTFSGAGRIELSDSANNRISPLNLGAVLTNGPNHTIQGAGNLLNNKGGLVNEGAILADQPANSLNIDPDDQGFVNQGTLRAAGSAGLRFEAGRFVNDDHTIEVLEGSKLTLANNTVVQGGVLSSAGSGAIMPGSGAVFDGTTLEGHVVQANGVWPVDLVNGLVNDGLWSLNGNSGLTRLRYDGSQTLSGAGRIVMSDSVNNQISPKNAGDVLTNGRDHTIQGAGRLLNNNGGMINEGTILADQPNTPLSIAPDDQGFVNRGALQAVGPAGLRFEAGRFVNDGYVIEVLDGSKLALQSGSVVQGGVLSSAGSGAIMPGSGAVFDGTTLEGHVVQANGVWPVDLVNGLVNNGRWSLNGNSATTWLRYDGSQTISGSGRIEMSDSVNNRISPLTSSEVLTNGPNHTIQGAGRLLNNDGGLVNQGIIKATGTNAVLRIDPNTSGFANQGSLQAFGPAGMAILTGPFETSGQVEVAETSRLDRTGDYVQTGGSTRVDGALAATGAVRLQGGTLSGAGTVSSLANPGGQVTPGASAGRLHVDGDFSQSGTGALVIEIGGIAPGTDHDQLAVTGDASLGGNLQVSLIGGYAPNVGDQFTILTATGNVTGTFAQGGVVQSGGQTFRIGYTDHEVILTYTGSGGETFASWQLTHFPNGLDKPEISGFDADPDGDGVANGFEFAGGSNPNDPNDVPDMTAGVEGNLFVVAFVRNQTALGVDITAEASQAVEPWTADPALLQSPPEVVDHGDGTETLRFLSAQGVADLPALFVRFVATTAP